MIIKNNNINIAKTYNNIIKRKGYIKGHKGKAITCVSISLKLSQMIKVIKLFKRPK